MVEETAFKVVRKDGVDTLHIEHPHEECNVDDAADVRRIDAMTADAMLARGHARRCEHCKPEPQG